MARKPRADGSKFALEAAAELARPLPEPLLPLSPRAEKYWPRIIAAKMLNLWTDADLDTAWGLCEDLAKLEELRLALQKQPILFKDGERIKEHPAVKLIEEFERRIQATKRHLQINSAAVNGPSHHIAGKNEAARSIATALDDATDDLIARPKLRIVK